MDTVRHLQVIDFAVIAGYFSIVILVGSWFGRYVRHARDYFTAGANIPWWLAAISFWMATFSSLGFVTYSELSYKYGITAFTLYFLTIPGMLIGAIVFVGRWRRARQMSPIGFIETRFSPALKQVFVWTGFPLRLIDNAIRIYATAIFLTAALPDDIITMTGVIWLTGIVTLSFSLFGGQWSVIVTDFVQFIVLCLAVCLVFPLSFGEVGGLSSFMERLPVDFWMVLHPPYDFYQVVTWIVLTFFTFNAGWAMIQKYNCVRSERDARWVVYAVAAWSVIGPIIFYTPAMIARILYPELDNPRFSYAVISLRVLPVGLMGIMISAMFSATLSTLSNEFTMLSSVLTSDFYARKINPAASDKHLVNIGRLSAFIVGIMTTGLAVLLQYVQGMNLFDIMVKAYTAFAPAIMVPLLAGIIFRRVNSQGALLGIVMGFTSGSLLLVLNMILVAVYHDAFVDNEVLNYWLNQGWSSTSIIINFAMSVAGVWIGSIRGRITDDERIRTSNFFILLGKSYIPSNNTRASSPFPVIGIVVSFMGLCFFMVAILVSVMYSGERASAMNYFSAVVLLITGLSIFVLSRKHRI